MDNQRTARAVMASDAWNLYVFRDGKSTHPGKLLQRDLIEDLNSCNPHNSTELVDLLLRAGEWECALADAELPERAALITDGVAAALVRGAEVDKHDLLRIAATGCVPFHVQLSTPEGFAYYALHPLDYADLVKASALREGYAAVIGIRSIGVTLSAVVLEALRDAGVNAERITVRPHGHPYDRKTQFTPEQLRWIAVMRSHSANWFVVDEGPGISGSSFLSVGEALIGAGVSKEKITFLCSREVDPTALRAPNAAERWAGFRVLHASTGRHLPSGAGQSISGGRWRERFLPESFEWPSSWLTFEKLKFLSAVGAEFFKFEGFGRLGAEVYVRSLMVAEAGFGPRPLGRDAGFGVYPLLGGRPLTTQDKSEAVLERLGDYCAFRLKIRPQNEVEPRDLECMMQTNVLREFGIELPAELAHLPVKHAVVPDGRMLPHKWLEHDGVLMKVDSSIHGADHFFPGPTDIAWDLAGTIVEWGLNDQEAGYLILRYRQKSGDRPEGRLPSYLIAYTIFRMAFCKMAAAAMQGTEEHSRLIRDYLRYRNKTLQVLRLHEPRSRVLTTSSERA